MCEQEPPPQRALPSRRRVLRFAAGAAALGVGAFLRAQPSGPLTVWFTVEGAKAMRKTGERFTAATGIDVIVETPDDGPSKFQQAASAGKGPDIYVYAHDRIGEWVASGLLHSVTPSRALIDDIDPLAWRGFTWRGRLWGYPYAIEAITLLHNKALVPVAPKSFDEVFALEAQLARQGKHAILWDYTNAYFTWPLLAAGGGYAFKPRADGSFDVRDTGVANEGSVHGAALLERLIKEGAMPAGSGYAEMEAAVAQGRAAMMINGPWAWVNLKRVGMDFGVAPIPSVGGHAARPFVGIKGLMINRATNRRELAVEFIERWLLSLEGLRAINAAEPIGAPASRMYFNELASDAKIAGIMASARDGVPTPAVPEMGRFWAAMKTSLTTLAEGRQNAQQAMDAAARRITAP
jgi:maltose/maltodextrin transport system substrate-binding protein